MTAATEPGPEPVRRSLWARVRRRSAGGAVVLGLLAVVLAVDRTLERPWVAVGVAVLLGMASAFELGRMFRARGAAFPGGLLFALAAALFAAKIDAYVRGGDGLARTLGIACAAFMVFQIREVLRGDVEGGVDLAGRATLAFGCITLYSLLVDLLLALPAPAGIEACLFVVLVSKSNDIGGYLVGSAVGGPKLAPRVSPGKTRAGSVGGLALGVLVAFLLAPWVGVRGGALWVGGFAVAIGLANQLGDLSESLLKRYCGVKDSGGYVPTFGGALDMIDSLVFAAPVGYWFGVVRGEFVPV